MAKCELKATPVIQVAIDLPLDTLFDYRFPAEWLTRLKPGSRVRVPFGNTSKTGVIMGFADSHLALSRLKTITEILDPEPLINADDLKLLQWASRYYHHPIGEVIMTAFPIALRAGKPANIDEFRHIRISSAAVANPNALRRGSKQQALFRQLQETSTSIDIDSLSHSKRVVQALLDKGLVEYCPQPANMPAITSLPSPFLTNTEQQNAIDSVIQQLGRFSVTLLQGVTGSGKTEVYMQIIAEVLNRDLQVLVLLPEITLTPQLEHRFRQRFLVSIVCSHSKLNDRERLQAWLHMQQGKASILLGTRSALFTPLPKPGLIILDEEHDSSFKQQEGFRFSCRDVAIARGKMLNIPVLLGSATPSLESYHNAQQGRYHLLTLANRAGNASKPLIQVLDIRNKPLLAGLSPALIEAIRSTLTQHQQVLLFLNRRGFAPVQICHGCGWVARCHRCDANLVIHAKAQRLRCHHCGNEQSLKKICPSCNGEQLQALGLGTERIEQVLESLFPDKSILRIDRDTTSRKGALQDYLDRIHQGKVDIILGTQMLAKGHHFPNVTLVAILDIDAGLFSIDFRAGERLAQLISQVAGRAGRGDKSGLVLLQTHQPQHPLLITLVEQGYDAFVALALQERQQTDLPPFSHQALIRVQADNMVAPREFFATLGTMIARHQMPSIRVFGPVSAPMARRAGQFQFQLLLQSSQRKALHHLLDTLVPAINNLNQSKKIRWSLDIDPIEF